MQQITETRQSPQGVKRGDRVNRLKSDQIYRKNSTKKFNEKTEKFKRVKILVQHAQFVAQN